MKQYLFALLILGSTSSQYAQALQIHEQGIFDRMVVKLSEKERAAAEFEVAHAQNLAVAERQAAVIASGQVDQALVGSPTIDDELSAGIDKLTQIPLKQLAGVNADSKRQTKQIAQSLVQAKIAGKEAQAQQDADADRDDFEGFGSITAMAQHKDVLVERKLEDASFKAQLEAESTAKKAAEEKQKKDDEHEVQAEKDAKTKAIKEKLAGTKAKMEAALNKAATKKPAVQPVTALASKTSPITPKPASSLAAQTTSDSKEPFNDEEQVSGEAYQRAIASIETKEKKMKKDTPISLPTEQLQDQDGEQVGFLGKHSQKLAYKAKLEEAQEAVLGTKDPDAIEVPLSAEAPKHKGMLARAMEKDIKAQHEAEVKEKDQLLAEAMNDPIFKSQLDTIKTKTALQKNASYI